MLFGSWLSLALNRLRLVETHSYMLKSVRRARVRCTMASSPDATRPNTKSCFVYGAAVVQGRCRFHGRSYNAKSLQLATVSYPTSHAKFRSLLPEIVPFNFRPIWDKYRYQLHLALVTCFNLLQFILPDTALALGTL